MNPVSIVGAGPGAIDLMTIRALDRLKQAEVLVWTDSLIPPEISELAPKGCEKIRTSSLTLEEILTLLIDRHKKGKKIVRLHDGDPCLYGAIYEQICGLKEAGIEVEVVPGISAYQATAASLKAELTSFGNKSHDLHTNGRVINTNLHGSQVKTSSVLAPTFPSHSNLPTL